MPEYPGYQIGNQGTIIGPMNFPLKAILMKNGYSYIGIHGYYIRIHRLFALAWIPNSENKPCVDHINRNKNDNSLCNLRWATWSENNLNRSTSARNTSGIVGLSFNVKTSLWKINKQINGTTYQKTFQHRPDAELYLQQISTIQI